MTLVSDLAFSPGLLKLFDEILVNACDNMVRTAAGGSAASDSSSSSAGGSPAAPSRSTAASPVASNASAAAGLQQRMTRLDVHIFRGCAATRQRARITVANNGRGIPIVMHATEGIYVPELIFGHLLTGSNLPDDASASSGRAGAGTAAGRGKGAASSAGESAMSAATGGRHGYGAKLTNIFSHSFTVRIGDAATGQLYTQTWRHNMSVCEPPIITTLTAAADEGAGDATAGASVSAGVGAVGAAAVEPFGFS
jgi:DNA gyrase/topoisomerase IV subunit B